VGKRRARKKRREPSVEFRKGESKRGEKWAGYATEEGPLRDERGTKDKAGSYQGPQAGQVNAQRRERGKKEATGVS